MVIHNKLFVETWIVVSYKHHVHYSVSFDYKNVIIVTKKNPEKCCNR